MGQAHWYLVTRINQLSNFDIELDQSRYCQSLIKKYLDTAGTKRDVTIHTTPLPSGFVREEYNIGYASCIGSLIYLGMTRTDILYAVNKVAKFTKHPGRKHFDALIHVLRYLRDNIYLGICFYHDVTEAPITKMLMTENIQQTHTFYGFSDSSWNDDVDTGRSTGCFIIVYMGGVVDHSSNLLDPIAMSSAEAEYNAGCTTFMACNHLRMLLAELEEINESNLSPTNIYFDSKSAIAMGESYKDTKHTRHIMRRYHYVRECIASKQFVMKWIRTVAQIADIGTKNNPGPRHKTLVDLIHIQIKNPSSWIQEG
jgi:hypothetical protein